MSRSDWRVAGDHERVEAEARMDRYYEEPDRDDDRPTRGELAEDAREQERRDRLRAQGLIRTVPMLTADVPRCERKPDERLSACILDAGHKGDCFVARRVKGGAEVLRAATTGPLSVAVLTLAYPSPTRAEIAEEWAGREAFAPRPPVA